MSENSVTALGVEMDPSSDSPRHLRNLALRSGLRENCIAAWDESLIEGCWRPIAPLPTWSLPEEARSDSAPSPIYRFASSLLQHCADTDDVDSMSMTYAYVEDARGDALVAVKDSIFAWRDGDWARCSDSASHLTPAAVAQLLQGGLSVVVGSEEIHLDEELIELLEPDSDSLQEWFEMNAASEPGDLDPELPYWLAPYEGGDGSLTLVHPWSYPTLGPPSPDSSSEFHRARILALRLAREGYSVEFDWGSFVQSYDWAQGSNPSNGDSIFLDLCRGMEFWAAASGELAGIHVSASSPDALERVNRLAADFGIEYRFYKDSLNTKLPYS